ncbi:NAD(P)-dependent dehydrogenase (short-subunit alcohol dehydrogenase family) [Erwinia toletana]|uniref:NAD(P)-dependent dehydrogenase (Short-subunit alcohol dehydrogenase family) n=1 Tax=Winslowiella toletana TaxID=92490 RepID=A0ABS4P6F5_9GAMM|nr:SDR family NAD(P)-dependent oxidoreductase [Winslowiella toletana]MBP2168227.1 NAD(P)-dependent dehydrogenase (short-subunit alcohol dehydrogenase family) [Winslowiella toletana]
MSQSITRVAMISGGSRGIGAAIASDLLAHGWAVSLGCRTPHAVANDHPGQQINCHYDALDADSDARWIAETLNAFGRIDAVIHNAGMMIPRSVLEASDEEFDQLFAVNVKAPMRLSRKVWPYLKQSGSGRIVMLVSLSGKRVKSAQSSLYAMSKFAALALAHALRRLGDEEGIRSSAICPGFVATDMGTALTEVPAEKMTQPQDIAVLVRTLLHLPNSASIAEIPVNWTVEDNY